MHHPLFGRIEAKIIPIDAEIAKIGEGYLVNLLTKLQVEPERKRWSGYLCGQNIPLPQKPVDIASSELGYVKISHGRDEIEVYVEITRVFVTDEASDADGNPCVTAVWRHGIRVCPRG
ncbi:MAG: hypothetical protein RXQ56_06060 [Thermoproteus sp.]